MERIDEEPADVALVVDKIDQSLVAAMEENDRGGGTGPWVGLLGFSQGGKIAVSLLLRQQSEHSVSASLLPMLFAILIAGPEPLVWIEHTPPLPPSPEATVRLPTIHIHSKHDSVNSSPCEWLYHSCSSKSRKLLTWNGDHLVPTNTKDVAAVVKIC